MDAPALVEKKEWKTVSFRKRSGKKPSNLSLHRASHDRGNEVLLFAAGKSPNSFTLEAAARMNADKASQLGHPNSVEPSQVEITDGSFYTHLGRPIFSTKFKTSGPNFNSNQNSALPIWA